MRISTPVRLNSCENRIDRMDIDHQIIIIMSCCYSSSKKSLNFLFGTYMRLFKDLVFVDVQQKRIGCMIDSLVCMGHGSMRFGAKDEMSYMG